MVRADPNALACRYSVRSRTGPSQFRRPPVLTGRPLRIGVARSREGGREAGTEGGTHPRTASAPTLSTCSGCDQFATGGIKHPSQRGNILMHEPVAARDAREVGRRFVPPLTAIPIEMREGIVA